MNVAKDKCIEFDLLNDIEKWKCYVFKMKYLGSGAHTPADRIMVQHGDYIGW